MDIQEDIFEEVLGYDRSNDDLSHRFTEAVAPPIDEGDGVQLVDIQEGEHFPQDLLRERDHPGDGVTRS